MPRAGPTSCKSPKPLPLIITHGWPGSFVEMVKLIPLLTDPAAHGGRAEDAFDVIVPSLPGYGFSDRPTERGMNPFKMAALWARLMAELGYERFAAQGGDWGSAISTAFALDHAQRIVGIHLNYIAGGFLLGGTLNQTPDDEIARSYFAELRTWWDLVRDALPEPAAVSRKAQVAEAASSWRLPAGSLRPRAAQPRDSRSQPSRRERSLLSEPLQPEKSSAPKRYRARSLQPPLSPPVARSRTRAAELPSPRLEHSGSHT